jgi:hypothetical protein
MHGSASLFFEGVLHVTDYGVDFIRTQIEGRHGGMTIAYHFGYLLGDITLPEFRFVEVSWGLG